MGIKVIVTGATGMVGKGVLLECLDSPAVDQVLSVGRRALGLSHPKQKEVLLGDFENPGPIEKDLAGYQACYFCLGVSSAGMDEAKYSKVTYDLTVGFARVLRRLNADMVFCYVTGAGTDGTEKGSSMRGVHSNTPLYAFFIALFRPLFPILMALSNSVTASDRVGRAMLKVTLDGYSKPHLDGADINSLAVSEAE